MVIYFGADHRGFALKENLKEFVKNRGYEIFDVGNLVYDKQDDYPDYAAILAEKVSLEYENSKGILICGSGAGVCIAANKFPKIRAAFAGSPDQAFDIRSHDNSNILCLGADYLEPEDAEQIVKTWLNTPFSGEERHSRRLGKIEKLESSF